MSCLSISHFGYLLFSISFYALAHAGFSNWIRVFCVKTQVQPIAEINNRQKIHVLEFIWSLLGYL